MYKKSYYNIDIGQDNRGRHLIFNANTFSVAWLSIDEYQFLYHYDRTDNHSSFDIADMVRLGFLVDAERDEISEIQNQHLSVIRNHNPRKERILIAPTLRCNMHCKYCFESVLSNKKSMALDDVSTLVKFIEERISNNSKCQELQIMWFGGEPTLEIPVVLEISRALMAFCKQKGIVYSSDMISNGSLLTKNVAEQLVDCCGLKNVQITLDGMSETYACQKGTSIDSFYRVVQHIVDICDILKVTIRLNVHPQVEKEMVQLIEYLLKEQSLNNRVCLYFAPIFNCRGNEIERLYTEHEFISFCENLSNLFKSSGLVYSFSGALPRRSVTSCGAVSERYICIGPDMNLYRCEHLLGHEEYSIGNITDGITITQRDKKFIGYDIEPECRVCKFYPVCHGGCRASRVLDGITPDCKHMKEIVRFRVMNLLKFKRNIHIDFDGYSFCD